MQTLKERAEAVLVMSRKQFDRLLAGFPEDKATYQPTPAVNHATWIVGHVAHTEDWVGGALDGGPSALPADYEALFAYGSKMKSPGEYPPLAEVTKHLRAARDRLLAGLRAATEEKLAEHVPELDSDLMDVVLLGAFHEGWHCGQLSIIRRSLNLPSIYEGDA
jgi:hypothetical protein